MFILKLLFTFNKASSSINSVHWWYGEWFKTEIWALKNLVYWCELRKRLKQKNIIISFILPEQKGKISTQELFELKYDLFQSFFAYYLFWENLNQQSPINFTTVKEILEL